jgi:hypothetical protein
LISKIMTSSTLLLELHGRVISFSIPIYDKWTFSHPVQESFTSGKVGPILKSPGVFICRSLSLICLLWPKLACQVFPTTSATVSSSHSANLIKDIPYDIVSTVKKDDILVNPHYSSTITSHPMLQWRAGGCSMCYIGVSFPLAMELTVDCQLT